MTQNEVDFLPLRMTGVTAAGKRKFDAGGKRKLIDACLQPGASIAGLALKAGVNANQLHKWILASTMQLTIKARSVWTTCYPSEPIFTQTLFTSTRQALTRQVGKPSQTSTA